MAANKAPQRGIYDVHPGVSWLKRVPARRRYLVHLVVDWRSRVANASLCI